MDIHLSATEASPIERAAVDAALGPRDTRPPPRDRLLPALWAVQSRVGHIGEGALSYICERLDVPPAEAYSVASFYALFSLDPSAGQPLVAHVCDDIACLAAGAEQICARLETAFGPPGTPTSDGRATWRRASCLGQCDRAPAALVMAAGSQPIERALAPVDPPALQTALRDGALSPATDAETATLPRIGGASLRLLRRVGRIDPTSLDDYRAHGGYEALRRAVRLGPDGVIREVVDAKLVGRGGAAFPTGRKWEAVAHAAARPHYLVCNADESEPGMFKDRVLMEHDPFAIIEAMTIAGYATGCEQGYVYVRGEYPLAFSRLRNAVAQAQAKGLLGDDVLGRGFRFDIEPRRGAGAYVCGEETALFSSIEGYRGEPRNRPPFPTQSGLFGRPTAVNNVETLVNVLEILREGGPAFAAIGTRDSTGTKLFCVSGRVDRPGVYEVPFGTTLRALLDLAGGLPAGRTLRAVLLGGAAGSVIPPEQVDMPLTFEAARARGVALGSGAVIVFDDTVDLRRILLRVAAFFRDESCGQCVPCRIGTVRQEELLERLVSGRPHSSVRDELALLADIGRAMRDASICGLGQTASTAVESAVRELKLFADGGDT